MDGSLVRNGKIARLPAVLREALNRALARGVSGPALLKWINEEREARAVLRREFKGRPISPQNLSEWRQGGFRDWLHKQEAREVLCEFAAHHQNLSALELNEKVALWLGARMVCMTVHLEQLHPQDSWSVVRQMVRDVASLRRGDHRIREQKFKEQAKDKITREEHMRWAMEPGRLDWLVRETLEREGREAEEIREIRYALFGMLAGDDPEDLAWEARRREVPIEQLDEAREAEYGKNRALWHAEAAPERQAEKAGPAPGKKSAPRTRLRSQAPARQASTKRGRTQKALQQTGQKQNGPRTRTIKDGTKVAADQGNSNQIKPNQTESNRNSPPAATPQKPKKPHSPESSSPANQTPLAKCDSTARTVGSVGPLGTVRLSEKAAETAAPAPGAPAAAPAPEKPRFKAGALTPMDLERMLAMCDCGSMGHVRAEDCPRCQIRPAMGRFYCPCHKVWEYRLPEEHEERQPANVTIRSIAPPGKSFTG